MKSFISFAAVALVAVACFAQAPTPTPAPDVISLPAPSIYAKLEASAQTVATGQGFAVFYDVTPGTIVTWRNTFPPGAVPPMKGQTDDGRNMLVFFNSTNGTYTFSISAQLSVDKIQGPDPIATNTVSVTVQGAMTPPVVVAPTTPTTPTTPPSTTKASSATYVYEKSKAMPTPAILTGLNRLNREKKIVATAFEWEATDGTDEVPEQYKLPLKTAEAAGVPNEIGGCLVVQAADGTVINIVKAPKTEEQVFGAAQ